jgi:predicted nuclease of predicted toxin-antitoxin system
MTIGLLANENFPVPAVRKLRAAGIDVVAVADAMPAASDAEVLAFARQQGRWIVTFDRDYGELVFKDGLPAPQAVPRSGR